MMQSLRPRQGIVQFFGESRVFGVEKYVLSGDGCYMNEWGISEVQVKSAFPDAFHAEVPDLYFAQTDAIGPDPDFRHLFQKFARFDFIQSDSLPVASVDDQVLSGHFDMVWPGQRPYTEGNSGKQKNQTYNDS